MAECTRIARDRNQWRSLIEEKEDTNAVFVGFISFFNFGTREMQSIANDVQQISQQLRNL